MIKNEARDALIQYRLQQASETVELARFLVANDKLMVAVNRIYYAMYYSLTALALRYAFETSKHAQLVGWFNKEFVATKMIDTQYGKILRNAFQNRTKGDYDAFITFTKDEVTLMLEEMVLFVNEINRFLSSL